MVLLYLGQQILEYDDVNPTIAGPVELDGGAGDEEKRGLCAAVADGVPEVGEGLAQVVVGHLVRQLGP